MEKKIFWIWCIFSMYTNGAYSQELNNIQGMVSLDDCKLFVNISSLKYTSDDEVYLPTLFTMVLPKTVSDYWYNLSAKSQYIFYLEGNQLIFVFDEARICQSLFDSLSIFIDDITCLKITKEEAVDYIRKLESNSYERDIWLGQRLSKDSLKCENQYYIARNGDVIFVFLNISNINHQKIVNDFITIRSHSFIKIDNVNN